MNKRLLWLAALVGGLGCAVAPPPGAQVSVGLPHGDATLGRVTFVDLRCTSCHAVHGDSALPPVVTDRPGPTLGSIPADWGPQHLADSIVEPSQRIHYPASIYATGGLSRMGAFNEVMTVQQLADLVAYLDSAGNRPIEYEATRDYYPLL